MKGSFNSDTWQRALRALDTPPSASDFYLNEDVSDEIDDHQSLIPAAVLVPLISLDDGLSLLFTRRATHLKHHAGQISFPGGRVESYDDSVLAAALRETHEEIGIDPTHIQPLGYLDCHKTGSGFCVTPLVGYLMPGFKVTLDALEVTEIFAVPLKFLSAAENLSIRQIDYRSRAHKIYEYTYGSHRIWGATAAIVVNLIHRLALLTKTRC